MSTRYPVGLHLAVPSPGSAWTWPAGLLGLGHGCHALPHLGLLGLGLEEDGRGCVQQLTLVQVLGVVLEEVGLGVEEKECGADVDHSSQLKVDVVGLRGLKTLLAICQSEQNLETACMENYARTQFKS